jgi:hypothetical protein
MNAATSIPTPRLKDRETTDLIVVHCSATGPAADIGVAQITQWHKQRGFDTVGYHYVIRRNGTLETGRRESEIGAHVRGHNANSIGVCLAGGVDAKGKPVIRCSAMAGPARGDAVVTGTRRQTRQRVADADCCRVKGIREWRINEVQPVLLDALDRTTEARKREFSGYITER